MTMRYIRAMQAKHIGIVACSAEGAALCYRTICSEGSLLMGTHAHPEVSMHTHSLARYMEVIDRDDWDAVGELMLSSAEKLAAAGAELLICPDNTIHRAFAWVERRSPLPWLHIARVVADAALARGFKRLALTGTRFLVESDVYPAVLEERGLAFVRPEQAERIEINRIIFDELVRGIFEDSSRRFFQNVVDRFRDEGCDAVILGCTEIPLIIDDTVSSLPTLDSTRLLARAALEHALGA
jgi:aspartate racemase